MNGTTDTSIHARRAVNGDARSVGWIIDRFSPLLLAQAHYRMGDALKNRVPPEDLVQETWAVALPRLGQVRSRANRIAPVLMKYLSSILLHRINRQIRARIRHEQRTEAADVDDLQDEQQVGVITNATRREILREVFDRFAELGAADREVLVLRLLEQRSGAEVAELLGVSREVVYTRHHRALETLRKRLPNSMFDELDVDAD